MGTSFVGTVTLMCEFTFIVVVWRLNMWCYTWEGFPHLIYHQWYKRSRPYMRNTPQMLDNSPDPFVWHIVHRVSGWFSPPAGQMTELYLGNITQMPARSWSRTKRTSSGDAGGFISHLSLWMGWCNADKWEAPHCFSEERKLTLTNTKVTSHKNIRAR